MTGSMWKMIKYLVDKYMKRKQFITDDNGDLITDNNGYYVTKD